MPEQTIACFAHKTELGHNRICIRFGQRPDASIIVAIKSHGGRYRKAKDALPCWYVPLTEGNVDRLAAELNMMTQLGPNGEANRLFSALVPFLTEQPSDDDEASEVMDGPPVEADGGPVLVDAVDDDAGEPPESQDGPPPRKRLRVTESRRSRVPPCRACIYEADAIARGDGFGQYYHTCEESQS